MTLEEVEADILCLRSRVHNDPRLLVPGPKFEGEGLVRSRTGIYFKGARRVVRFYFSGTCWCYYVESEDGAFGPIAEYDLCEASSLEELAECAE